MLYVLDKEWDESITLSVIKMNQSSKNGGRF